MAPQNWGAIVMGTEFLTWINNVLIQGFGGFIPLAYERAIGKLKACD
jgi:hypothetical protein